MRQPDLAPSVSHTSTTREFWRCYQTLGTIANSLSKRKGGYRDGKRKQGLMKDSPGEKLPQRKTKALQNEEGNSFLT
jgi:hypothetical protein